MTMLDAARGNVPAPLSRRALFSVLPAGAFGCLGCARALACQQTPQAAAADPWTEKSDMTWEEVFRFAFQKDLIPLLKEMGGQMGREKLVTTIKQSVDSLVEKKSTGRPTMIRDLTTLAAMAKRMPPLMQHALELKIVEESPEVFEYRVSRCLWAKAFLDDDAGDIGYAMVCYPDYAVAKSLNPKLRLTRTQTLMQGDDHCGLRYTLTA